MDCGKNKVNSHSVLKQHALTRRRRLYATVTFNPSQELHREIIDIFTEEIQGIKSTANLTTSVVVQPLHINSIRTMNERGGNALGIESDESLLSECLISIIRSDLVHTLIRQPTISCTPHTRMGEIRG